MNGKLISTVAAVVFLAGCASSPPSSNSYTYRDAFAGPDMDITLDNLLTSSEDRSYLVWLNAVRVREGAWGANYFLEVRYEGASDAGFLNIGPGETLLITVDGQPMKFRGPGSEGNRHETGRGTFVENAVYEAKPDDIRRLGKARDVKVQVNGAARRLYRELKPDNIQKFRSFTLTHMGNQ